MAIELIWAHLADFATVGAAGKVTIVGIFDKVFTEEGATIVPFPISHLVGMVRASVFDGPDHPLEFHLLDGNHTPITEEPAVLQVTLHSAGPGYPLAGYFFLHIMGLALPGPGDYELVVKSRDRRLGVVPLTVATRPS